jgi:hypothetical protein
MTQPTRSGALLAGMPEDPEPVPGCAACAHLAIQRADARARHDVSAAVDANILIRRHDRGHA